MKKVKLLARRVKFGGADFKVYLHPDADESVLAEIFDWREYRSAEEIIKKSALPILDVGAHIGIFSLYAKALNSAAEIFALEPEEKNFQLLKKNIKDNNLKGVKLFNVALAGKTDKRGLELGEDSINHRLLAAEASRENIRHVEIQAYSLHDFLEKNAIAQAGLLKMDVEGGEYEIFESLRKEDFAKIHNIILEYHNYGGKNFKAIENILRRNGFSVQIFPSGFDKLLGFILAKNKKLSNCV